jgi:acyl-CoA synthetase (AMP-forming)/AMP-acid ligase II
MSETLANVARYLPLQAARHPNMTAIRVPKGVSGGAIRYMDRSFAELDGDVDACARLMAARGIGRGTRTLLMVRQGLELIVCTFAILKVGAVPVVIDPGMGLKSFLKCVKRTGPEALVGIAAAQIVSRVFRGSFRTVKHRVAVNGGSFWRELDQYREGGSFPVAGTRADDLAAILFTSGSTGAPKGVRYLHGMFESQFRLLDKLYHFIPGEVNFPMLPVFALFNPALGMTSVIPDLDPSHPAKADPEKLVAALVQNRVTNSFGSPVLWRKVADYCEKAEIPLPYLRVILIAGASVPADLVRRLRSVAPNAECYTPYGATEGLPLASVSGAELLGEAEQAQHFGAGSCVGRAAPEVELGVIRVTDGPIAHFDESLLLPQGEIGEIVACGPVVTEEYDLLPEATAAAKMRDSQGRVWHRMGDLGRFDAEGRLWFCGRKAERVVTEKGILYTDCCEGVFNVHPDVSRTALVGIRRGGKIVPAIVVEPKKGKFPWTEKAKNDLAEELMVLGKGYGPTSAIDTFFFERRFPVDVRHNAKIHRLALARKYSER